MAALRLPLIECTTFRYTRGRSIRCYSQEGCNGVEMLVRILHIVDLSQVADLIAAIGQSLDSFSFLDYLRKNRI